MKEKVGEVFSIAADNAPVPGCTISKAVHSGENSILYFSQCGQLKPRGTKFIVNMTKKSL